MRSTVVFLIFVIYFSAKSTAILFAAPYRTCVNGITVDGNLFALVKNKRIQHGKCWRRVTNGSTLKAGDLSQTGEAFQFSMIVAQKGNQKYDRMFLVLVKELLGPKEDPNPYIGILRKKITTMCRRTGGRIREQTWGEFYAEFPGNKFNRFHKSAAVTRGRLAKFHVAFLNASRNCVRTDDEDGGLRASFVINGVKFPDLPESRLLANILGWFQTDSALAFGRKEKFKRYRIGLKQAKISATGMLAGNFFIDASKQVNVKVQDLSNTKHGQRNLLSPLKFKIRKTTKN